MLIAIAGDVHGDFRYLFDCITIFEQAHGRSVEYVLQVGDLEPTYAHQHLKHMTGPAKLRQISDLPYFVEGSRAPGVPKPVYFIGGNHEPYDQLDFNREFLPKNLHYLGRVGGVELKPGILVVGISGIYYHRFFDIAHHEKPLFKDFHHAFTYYCKKDFEHLEMLIRFARPAFAILLLHDWPHGIVPSQGQNYPSSVRLVDNMIRTGSKATPDLIRRIMPDMIFAGHMHASSQGTIQDIPIHCLSRVIYPGGLAIYELLESQGKYDLRIVEVLSRMPPKPTG
jgi:lariat debranching enzyme